MAHNKSDFRRLLLAVLDPKMEASLIAACAALVVAIIGSAVNFIIAKQMQRAASENARLAAAIRQSEDRVKLLRDQCRGAEKLRIAAWWLQDAVDRRRAGERPQFSLQESEEHFREAWTAFFESWADVRSAVPDSDLLDFTRELRHTCRHDVQECLDSVSYYKAAPEADRHKASAGSWAALERLREHLDFFLEVVNAMQLAEVRAAFFGDNVGGRLTREPLHMLRIREFVAAQKREAGDREIQ